jgi:hypothetical protein
MGGHWAGPSVRRTRDAENGARRTRHAPAAPLARVKALRSVVRRGCANTLASTMVNGPVGSVPPTSRAVRVVVAAAPLAAGPTCSTRSSAACYRMHVGEGRVRCCRGQRSRPLSLSHIHTRTHTHTHKPTLHVCAWGGWSARTVLVLRLDQCGVRVDDAKAAQAYIVPQ